jgi:hypothetical protein
MRLNSKQSKADVEATLTAAIASTWGEDRVAPDLHIIKVASNNIWLVLQCPLEIFSEEPDFPLIDPHSK